MEAKARLDQVSQIINSEDLDPSAVQVATVADALKSEVISKLREQYLDSRSGKSFFRTRVGHDHLAVVNIRNQMREVRRSIFEEIKRIAAAYKSEYDIAKARENSLQRAWPRLFLDRKRRTIARRSNCVNLKVRRNATVRSITTSNSATRIMFSNNPFP